MKPLPPKAWLVVGLLWFVAMLNYLDRMMITTMRDPSKEAGRDEILVAGLALGAKGAIGSTYNFAAPVYNRILKAFAQGDLATAQVEQARANAMISVFIRFGGLTAGKSIMRLIGLDCGPVRLPLRSLSKAQEGELRVELEKVGFFDFCSVV